MMVINIQCIKCHWMLLTFHAMRGSRDKKLVKLDLPVDIVSPQEGEDGCDDVDEAAHRVETAVYLV